MTLLATGLEGPCLDSHTGHMTPGAVVSAFSPYQQKAQDCGIGTTCAEGRALLFWDPQAVLWLELFQVGIIQIQAPFLSEIFQGPGSCVETLLRLRLPSDYHCSFLNILLNICRTISLLYSWFPCVITKA